MTAIAAKISSSMRDERKSIAFAWSGLPDYAARCIRAVIERHPGSVGVIGTRPTVPIEGMETSLGQPVHWIDGNNRCLRWQDIGLTPPGLFFQGGYYWPAFRSLGAECRASGGKVVGQSDATWQRRLRQRTLDPIRHRLFLRHNFDGWFVPGRSGLQHARIMGYSSAITMPGMLGADPKIFGGGDRLTRRPRALLFAGSLDANKNVVALCRAFVRFSSLHSGWTLKICGSGPLVAELPVHSSLSVENFVQPATLAQMMRHCRCLVLPSLREAWGLVVHEAALSGCALALSSSVGAIDDLAQPENSVIFAPGSESAIENALHELARWDDNRWRKAELVSRQLAQQFGPEKFADAVDQFIDMFDLAHPAE